MSAKDAADVAARSLRSAQARYQDIPEGLRPSWEVMIAFLIDDVARLQRAALDQLLRPLGAGRAHWSLMSEIALNPGLKQIELAEQLGLSRVAITQLVERLVETGLVEARADAADRRIRRIFLTPKGAEVLDDIRKVGFDFLAGLSRSVSPEDRQTLLRELEGMKAALLAGA